MKNNHPGPNLSHLEIQAEQGEEERERMAKTKHTPSPLEVSEYHEGEGYDILAELKGEGNGWHEIAMHIEKREDAHLFAAAPEMLEVCQQIILESELPEQGCRSIPGDIIAGAAAAISKAQPK